MPVELNQISRELKKLWAAGEGVNTRASLVNFVVYCESQDSMERSTSFIADFVKSHACHAILIALHESGEEPKVEAFISAHCNMSRAGAKQVCCEQVTLSLSGNSRELVPNLILSNLDSDLPLYVWWQSEFPAAIETQLWSWVDRIIFDSATWKNTKAQFRILRRMVEEEGERLIPCDLNWARLLSWRWAFARVFDHPENLARLSDIQRVTISHGPGFRSTAALLTGWFMAQLGWHDGNIEGDQISFDHLRVELKEEEGAAINNCIIQTGDSVFSFTRESKKDFLKASFKSNEGKCVDYVMPCGHNRTLDLLNEELMRGGKHKVYLKALASAEPLL